MAECLPRRIQLLPDLKALAPHVIKLHPDLILAAKAEASYATHIRTTQRSSQLHTHLNETSRNLRLSNAWSALLCDLVSHAF